jgi:hypothetical protein
MGATQTLPQLPVAKPTAVPNIPGIPPVGSGAIPTAIPGAPAAATPSSTGQGTGVGTIAVPTTGISSGLSTVNGSNTFAGDFTATYGQGTGTALADTLAGLGTATDAAVTSTNQSILNSAGIQEANLKAGNAAAGLSADSSSSALSLGDFSSQVSQEIATTDSQMELSEENTLIQSLFQEGGAHGSDSSFMSSLGDFLQGGGLGAVGNVAGAVQANEGSGPLNSGAAGTAIDLLAGL